MPRTVRPVVLALDLGPDDGEAPAARLAAAIVRRIAEGALADGDPLPSSRRLAADVGMPRSAVVGAYEELISAGYLAAIGGSGTTVAAGAVAAARAGAGTHVARQATPAARTTGPRDVIPFDLRPGLSDQTLLDAGEWRRAVRQAASGGLDPDLPWLGDAQAAQDAVAAYVRTTRGVRAEGDAVALVPGTSAAFRALVAAFAPELVVVENPGYREATRAFGEAGVPLLAVDVDADGLQVAELPERRCLVYVTPSHQFPLGHRLSVERRAALVAWAQRTGSLVVEDDYDGEFRYDLAPLPALQSLEDGPQVVAYVGTASKILASSLQVAWVVAPPQLRDGVREALARNRQGVAPVLADTVAALADSGALQRQVARAGRIYRARRTALLEALYDAMPWCRVVGLEAGLHLTLMLPGFIADEQAVTELAARGLACRALSPYYLTEPRPGLVLGYTRLREEDAPAAAAIIAEVVAPR